MRAGYIGAIATRRAAPEPPPSGDPLFGNVILLMPFDGDDESTAFIDHSELGVVPESYGPIKLSTAEKEYGTASLSPGENGYLILPENPAFYLGSGEFCIEASVYGDFGDGSRTILGQWGSNFWFGVALGKPAFYNFGDVSFVSPTAIDHDTWTKLAAFRKEDTLYLAVDGTVVATKNLSAGQSFGYTTDRWYIAAHQGPSAYMGSGRYIDNLRVTKGASRYSGSYTPESGPFPTTFDGPAPTGHRFWRVYISAVQSGPYTSIQELEFRASVGGASLCVGGTPYGSSFVAGQPPEYAFDGNLSNPINAWTAGAPDQWVLYHFPQHVTVAEVSILPQNRSDLLNRSPKDFKVQHSDDGVTWTDAATFTGVAGWTLGVPKQFSI